MSLSFSYAPSYFSIEDILATQERVPCKFLMDIPKMGKLNPAADDDNLTAGTVLELPMWLVQPLCTGRQAVVAPELPRIYSESYREILKADPCAVDLHKLNLHFYEFGLYSRMFDRRDDVVNILITTFITRFRKLRDLADNIGSDPTAQDGLDVLEKSLFSVGNKARKKLDTWFVENGLPLEAANMVTNHKKRKRVDMEDII